MKVRTTDELINALDNNLSWRKKEIIDYKFLIEKNKNSLLSYPLIRGGIAIIYAHWEGFIKEASDMLYLYKKNIF